MEFRLSEVEVRVLGSLMEKEMSTPEYYPLSLHALVNACNQKSNREPVVNYDEQTLLTALQKLKEKQLVYETTAGRVPKYGNSFTKVHNLLNKEAAVMCVLMLRGPQTAGELRSRTERMYKFASVEEVEETINDLRELNLAATLPRQPGQKECRHMHLLSGPLPETAPLEAPGRTEAAPSGLPSPAERLRRIEDEIVSLRQEIAELKQAFLDFKRQFE